MDKPITQITNIKSLQQLKDYLQKQSQLNLSVLSDKSNSTLLHFSAYKNDLPKMKLFIKHFKQFTQINHGPSVYTSGGSTFADKLKAWINSPNKQGYVPLLYAGLHGNLQMIQFLQQCGANMHFRTTKNEGILFMCVQNNRIKPLIYLLQSKHNYNVNMTNEQGDTILHQACSKGYTQIVGYLLSVGADIQASNNKGQTPLIVATREFKKQTIKLLLIKGANREAKNSNGETALQIAAVNQKDDLVKILDNNYGTCDKIKIKCNKKITYEPEKSSYLYSIYFMVLYHLFFLPVNLLSQIKTDERYIQFIPFVFEGIYQLIILALYFSLLRKPKRKKQVPLMLIQGNFCPECNRGLGNKTFHCFICQRCIYRYDHHCPWINNCVGAHNIGRFTLFLFALLIGLIEVTFCSVCLIIPDNQFIRYRKSIQIPDQVHIPLNVVTILFSSLLAFAILNLLIDQFKNLFTNSTQFERQKKQRGASTIKKPQLLGSEVTLNQSFTQDFDEEQRQRPKNFISNCCDMLKQKY